jgi:hypothetical protein
MIVLEGVRTNAALSLERWNFGTLEPANSEPLSTHASWNEE